jgi:dCTP deaminase
VILTGEEIARARERGEIVIEPYHPKYLEPNSYAFHLGAELVEYTQRIVDANGRNSSRSYLIPEAGFVLEPGRFYLGHTLERIGGVTVTSELFANLSTASAGMWVQTSAPLGHVGAVISWTMEICVAQSIRVYAGMKLGKVCFWKNNGVVKKYRGKYTGSVSPVPSRLYDEK